MNQSFKATRLGHRSLRLPLMMRPLHTCLFIMCLVTAGHGQSQTLDDPLFASAMAHVEKGEWQQAEGLLKHQLSQNPDLHRARIELALVYVHLQQISLARLHFDKLLKVEALPDNVRRNIQQLRAQLDEPEPEVVPTGLQAESEQGASAGHQVQSYLQVGWGYDSNVRFSSGDYFLEDDPFLDGVFVELEDGMLVYVSPDGFVYDANGVPLFENNGQFNLGDSDKGNMFAEAKLAVAHEYDFGRQNSLNWHNSMSIQASENAEFSDFNKMQVRLETGLDWQVSEQWKSSVAVHHRFLKRDGQVLIRVSGIEPELTYYTPWGSWTLGLEWMQRDYEDATTVNGDFILEFRGFETQTRGVSAKWSRLFWDNDLLLLGKIEYLDSNSSDGFDYEGYRASAAMVWDITENLSWSLSATHFHQDYSDVYAQSDQSPEEFVPVDLEDESTIFRSRLSYALSPRWEFFVAAERATRTSDIYGGISSNKTSIQAGMKVSF